MVAFISLWLKPEEHVILPAVSIMLILTSIYIVDNGFFDSYSYKHWIFVFIISIPIYIEINRQSIMVETERKRAAYYSSVVNFLKTSPAGLTVLNIGSWDDGHHKLFEENVFSNIPHAYVLDGAKLYFNRNHQNLLRSITGTSSFIGQWEFFIKNKDCVFVSNADRMNLILHYLNVVYGRHYFSICKKQFDSTIKGQMPLAIYEVSD